MHYCKYENKLCASTFFCHIYKDIIIYSLNSNLLRSRFAIIEFILGTLILNVIERVSENG